MEVILKSKRAMAVVAAGGLALLMSLTACSSPAETQGAGDSAGETSAVSETVKALVEEASGPQPWAGPLDGPIAEPGKKIVSIPCGLAAAGCSRWDAGVHEAAEALGWDVTTIDPAFDPGKANDAAARKAGIAVVTTASGYENEPITEDFINYDLNGNSPLAGKWTGAALCEGLNGKGTALLVDDPQYLVATQRIDAAEKLLKEECPNITVTRQTASSTDFGTVGQSKAVATLQANPDVNAILFNSDAYANDYLVALQQLGLNDSIDLYSMGAEEQFVSSIKDGGPAKASVGLAAEGHGWATLDATNRILHGQEGPPNDQSNVMQRMVTADWIPEGGKYEGDVDFRAIYTKLWSTGKAQA
jgi:ribose transport system substrate-binding protein